MIFIVLGNRNLQCFVSLMSLLLCSDCFNVTYSVGVILLSVSICLMGLL